MMNPLKNSLLTRLTVVSVVVCLFSCSGDSEITPSQAMIAPTAEKAAGGIISPFGFPISLDHVDIFTIASPTLTGTVTVQIATSTGSVLASTTVSGSSLVKGDRVKNTFYFPALTLISGQKYRINVIRSNQHNYVSDYLYWASSSFGVDAYPKGTNNFNDVFDFAFVTYSDGYTDQQQTNTNYGFAVGNSSSLWQEFVPSKIWIVAQ